jgi:hypothetical protein
MKNRFFWQAISTIRQHRKLLNKLQKKWIMLSNPEALPTYPSDVPQKCIDYIFGLKNEVFIQGWRGVVGTNL